MTAIRRSLPVAALLLCAAVLARPAAAGAGAGFGRQTHQDRDLPELTQPVNDFAHIIDPESAREIDRVIRTLKAASGDVVIVATVPSFEPYADINEYAVKLFENHGRGIGDKGKDNGLLIVLALKERQDRVEVGYDLEQWITDGYAGETRREFMAPLFRQGQVRRGAARRNRTDRRAHRARARCVVAGRPRAARNGPAPRRNRPATLGHHPDLRHRLAARAVRPRPAITLLGWRRLERLVERRRPVRWRLEFGRRRRIRRRLRRIRRWEQRRWRQRRQLVTRSARGKLCV